MKLIDIMPVNSTGVKTHRDHFVIDFSQDGLYERIRDFRDLSITNAEIAETYDLQDTRDWKLSAKRRSLAANQEWKNYFTQCLYRPFDTREYFHHEDVVELPRHEVMHHMLTGNNLGLIACRQQSQQGEWTLVGVTKWITESCAISNKTKEANYVFPLYLYPDPIQKGLFDASEASNASESRRPNFSPQFIDVLTTRLKLTFVPDGKGDLQFEFGPEDIFNYMYAIFHSLTYRSRYAEFLKIDFPRLPITSNVALFCSLCAFGDQLVGLHLMEKYGQNIPKYPEPGSNVVEKVEYTQLPNNPLHGKVWINKAQYFEGVSIKVWEFHIGAYQVCYKWLKDRKGRILSFDDIKHYQRIVAALAETISLMDKIDEKIEEYGGWPIN